MNENQELVNYFGGTTTSLIDHYRKAITSRKHIERFIDLPLQRRVASRRADFADDDDDDVSMNGGGSVTIAKNRAPALLAHGADFQSQQPVACVFSRDKMTIVKRVCFYQQFSELAYLELGLWARASFLPIRNGGALRR